MQISAIQSIAPIAASTSSVKNAQPTPAMKPSTTPVSSSPASASGAAATKTAQTGASEASASHGSGSSQSSSSSTAEASLAGVFSTTVGGKTYSADVEESGGEYTASVANLPGASASGPSVQAAEDSLGTVIDTLA